MSITSNTQLVTPAASGREIIAAPNATADNAVVAATAYIAALIFDNSANTAASFLKLYDASAPTVGTTDPDFIFKARGGEVLRMNFAIDKPRFATALSFACVTAGGTGGTTSPTSAIVLRLTVHG